MKKAEMQNLKKGQVVMDKRNNGEFTITEVTDVSVVLDEVKKVTMSTLQRWYVFIREPEVEVETIESVEVPNLLVVPTQLLLPAPQEEDEVETVINNIVKFIDQKTIDNINHGLLTLDEIEQISKNYGCEVKQCRHYIAVKYNGVSVVNIYNSKRKGIYPAFNHTIFTEEETYALDEAQIIGNGKWVCDLKFKLTSYEQYGQLLERAILAK
ncbi:MAG: hypothetical protein ACI3T9_04290 [Romboutsia timonensis]